MPKLDVPGNTVQDVTLIAAREAFGDATIGNYVFVIGGWNGGYLGSVERATLQ